MTVPSSCRSPCTDPRRRTDHSIRIAQHVAHEPTGAPLTRARLRHARGAPGAWGAGPAAIGAAADRSLPRGAGASSWPRCGSTRRATRVAHPNRSCSELECPCHPPPLDLAPFVARRAASLASSLPIDEECEHRLASAGGGIDLEPRDGARPVPALDDRRDPSEPVGNDDHDGAGALREGAAFIDGLARPRPEELHRDGVLVEPHHRLDDPSAMPAEVLGRRRDEDSAGRLRAHRVSGHPRAESGAVLESGPAEMTGDQRGSQVDEAHSRTPGPLSLCPETRQTIPSFRDARCPSAPGSCLVHHRRMGRQACPGLARPPP